MVVATLGNLRDKALGPAARDHPRARAGAGDDARRTEGAAHRSYHPAAALYTPAMLKVLEADFARLPELLGRAVAPIAAPEPEPGLTLVGAAPPAEQLGLF
jgi:hypothetical protein